MSTGQQQRRVERLEERETGGQRLTVVVLPYGAEPPPEPAAPLGELRVVIRRFTDAEPKDVGCARVGEGKRAVRPRTWR
jgi:hypothetical protein